MFFGGGETIDYIKMCCINVRAMSMFPLCMYLEKLRKEKGRGKKKYLADSDTNNRHVDLYIPTRSHMTGIFANLILMNVYFRCCLGIGQLCFITSLKKFTDILV